MTNEELVKLIQSDINQTDNLKQLYVQNERFIHMFARRYAHNQDDIDDLMQEGYFGLCEAVKRYEDTAGVLFMSYAKFWIKQAMIKYLRNNGRTIRMAAWLHDKIIQYKKLLSTFEMEKGRKPTDEEICYCMDISQEKLDTIKQAYHNDSMQSLDAIIPGSENEDLTFGDTVRDKSVNVEDTIVDDMMEQNVKTNFWRIIGENVNEQENDVLIMRYCDNMTLAAAGKKRNLTRARMRQIEATALKKLRRARVRRLLSEEFEVNYAREYRGGLTRFKNTWSSITEEIAIRAIEMENAGMG